MTDFAVEPFVGFRIFRVDMSRNVLTSFTSLGKLGAWMPGEIQESSCYHAQGHGKMPPAFNCTCGIWAVKSRRDLVRAYPHLADGVMARHMKNRRKKKVKQQLSKGEMSVQEMLDAMVKMSKGFARMASVPPSTPGRSASRPIQFQMVSRPSRGRSFVQVRHDPPVYLMSARVHLWGIVHEHQRGYRAQFAQIIPETIRWWPRQGAWFRPKQLAHIIDKYSVTEGGETDDNGFDYSYS